VERASWRRRLGEAGREGRSARFMGTSPAVGRPPRGEPSGRARVSRARPVEGPSPRPAGCRGAERELVAEHSVLTPTRARHRPGRPSTAGGDPRHLATWIAPKYRLSKLTREYDDRTHSSPGRRHNGRRRVAVMAVPPVRLKRLAVSARCSVHRAASRRTVTVSPPVARTGFPTAGLPSGHVRPRT